MIDTYGRERFEELLKLKHKTVKLSDAQLQEIQDTYRHKISQLDFNDIL